MCLRVCGQRPQLTLQEVATFRAVALAVAAVVPVLLSRALRGLVLLVQCP